MPVTEEELKATEQLLRLLEKTHKTLRLYQVDNEVCRSRMDEFHAAVREHLEQFGSCNLEFTEDSICVQDQVVYEPGERSEGLGFLFFRDGIRQLSLQEGVERCELEDLLAALSRVSVVANEEDDLVTLFWELDFSHIRYVAVEELPDVPEGPRLEEKLAAGTLKSPGDDADRVDLSDIQRPVSRLPVEDCLLDQSELENLQAELEAERAEDDLRIVMDLAADLALLEADGADSALLPRELVEVVGRVVSGQPLSRVSAMVERLDELASRVLPDEPSVRNLLEHVIGHLSSADCIDLVLNRVEASGQRQPGREMTAYLARLGPGALPALLRWLERLTDPGNRRSVTDAILTAGTRGVEATLHLLRESQAPSPTLLDEILYLARNLAGAAGVPLVGELLAFDDPEIRRQAARALGPYRDGPIGETWIDLLGDEDGEIRKLAMTALLRGGQPELAQPIAELTMTEQFTSSPLEEKMRAFAAIARLGGEQGLSWFADILSRPHPRWFTSRSAREMISAAAHAVAHVNSDRARELLEELAASGDRLVRAACRDAIKGIHDGP